MSDEYVRRCNRSIFEEQIELKGDIGRIRDPPTELTPTEA